ncbi:hypothetical protein EXIGLDRAFT_794457 [Exidia glandulosa HHB12029]|uniref:Uncharacterized protein n=1 Tax=Exidia glandulosa HHB12029 TaxID=1314781 RepID=A0A165GDZ4_EXIGL|nr:hypothetical protein EXIGLDRAFT_794457 [Exidia glandulosa HHB12029]
MSVISALEKLPQMSLQYGRDLRYDYICPVARCHVTLGASLGGQKSDMLNIGVIIAITVVIVMSVALVALVGCGSRKLRSVKESNVAPAAAVETSDTGCSTGTTTPYPLFEGRNRADECNGRRQEKLGIFRLGKGGGWERARRLSASSDITAAIYAFAARIHARCSSGSSETLPSYRTYRSWSMQAAASTVAASRAATIVGSPRV